MSDVRAVIESEYDKAERGEWVNRDLYEKLPDDEQALADALIKLYDDVGPLDLSDGIWVGYKSESDNEDAAIGVRCDNCALYEAEGRCIILDQDVDPGGNCRFAVIPPSGVDA
jgi:hypothetical protein